MNLPMVSSEKVIKYLTLTIASHTEAQRLFTTLIDNGTNPTDIVFEFQKTKIKTTFGRETNGYLLSPTEEEPMVAEKFRPSLTNSEEQSYVWVVPEEIVEFLKDRDGEPITMIDLYLVMKDQFPAIPDKDLKKYAVKLCQHNVLNLLNARQKWI
jgi:hypothetical protein